MRKGYRFAGTAVVAERGTAAFEALLGHYHGSLAPRLRAIVAITVTKALPLTSPVYDDGAEEPTSGAAGPRVFASCSRASDLRNEF